MTEKAIKKSRIFSLAPRDCPARGCYARVSLTQSEEYVRVAARLNRQAVIAYDIYCDEDLAGYVYVLEAKALGLHAVILDCGPVWCAGYGAVEDFAGFVKAFRQIYPKRFGRKIRFIPAMPNDSRVQAVLKAYGFSPKTKQGYQTVWMDLRLSLEELRKGLHGAWRNKLNRAQRTPIEIRWDDEGAYFPWIFTHYMLDKAERGYDGPSAKMLQALAMQFLAGKNMMVGIAYLDHQPIAAILLFVHESCASYQIGYTTDRGREACAHHLLIWDSFQVLKNRGVYDFDLGGVNDESAKGVKAFKKATGGKLVETCGIYVG